MKDNLRDAKKELKQAIKIRGEVSEKLKKVKEIQNQLRERNRLIEEKIRKSEELKNSVEDVKRKLTDFQDGFHDSEIEKVEKKTQLGRFNRLNEVTEKMKGLKKITFLAHCTSDHPIKNNVITYGTKQMFNGDGAFNPNSGKFIAPVSGIYHFHFSGTKISAN